MQQINFLDFLDGSPLTPAGPSLPGSCMTTSSRCDGEAGNPPKRRYRAGDPRFTLQNGEDHKTCATCLSIKHRDEFPTQDTTIDRLRKDCNKCYYQSRKKYKAGYKVRNKEAIAAYHKEWSARHPTYQSDYRSSRTIKRCDEICQRFGEDFSVHFRNVMMEPWFLDVTWQERVASARKRLWKEKFGVDVGESLMSRIRMMNLLQRGDRESLEFGWKCQSCSVFALDPRFFDIEHRVPQAKGGSGGSNKPDNLQVFCPNCHRVKTMMEFHGIAMISAKSPESNIVESCPV